MVQRKDRVLRPLDILRRLAGARINRAAGAPVLAVVPVRGDGLMPDPPDEPFLEGLRFLRAAIQTLPDRPPSVIIVYPAGEAPAAQDVALYLAHSFAEAGKRVKCTLPASGTSRTARKGQWMERVQVIYQDPSGPASTPALADDEYAVAYSATPAGQGATAVLQQAVLVFDPASATLSDLRHSATAARRAGATVAGVALCKRRRA
jgi:hypothetical protein